MTFSYRLIMWWALMFVWFSTSGVKNTCCVVSLFCWSSGCCIRTACLKHKDCLNSEASYPALGFRWSKVQKVILIRSFTVETHNRGRYLSKLIPLCITRHLKKSLFNWFLTHQSLTYLNYLGGSWAPSLEPRIFQNSRGCQLGVNCSSVDQINTLGSWDFKVT